ncbi:MAG: SURF1 family cytochrome oxidase biogenesis protein [Mycobacteriaceae bacterium]
MHRLRFLLRPGWIILALVIAGFAWACFTQLAPWQLGKNTATDARNARISASFAEAPVALSALVTPGSAPLAAQEWRVVTVQGRYLDTDQVLARLRTVDGTPAYEVLTPFRVTSGETVLVDRGYVRPQVGTAAPPVPAAPGGEVTLQGRLRLDESVDPARAEELVNGVQQVYSVNAALVGTLTRTTITPGYVQLSEGQPGVLGVLGVPSLDSGPYLSYGLQWLAFGIMAPLGLAYLVRSELRERKREREEGGDGADGAVPVPDDARAPRSRRERRPKLDPRDPPEPSAVPPGSVATRTRPGPEPTTDGAPGEDSEPDGQRARMLDRYGTRR